jgi:hypothetical protein
VTHVPSIFWGTPVLDHFHDLPVYSSLGVNETSNSWLLCCLTLSKHASGQRIYIIYIYVFSTGVACERSCRPFSFCLKVGPALSPLDPLWGKGGRSGVDLADVEGLGRSEDPSGLGAAGLLCETEAGQIPRVGWAGREIGGEE